MELVVVSKTHDVLQQARLVYLWTRVGNAHTTPIGLACYQTVAFEQLTSESFSHWHFVELRGQ